MARRVLGTLLLAMAAGQLSDLPGFIDVMETYRVGDGWVAGLLAVGLIAGEVVAGLGLFRRSSATHIRVPQLALLVAVAWSILGAQAFARGLALENCGCFGVRLSQPLRWWVLVQDLEFMALAWWTLRSAKRTIDEPTTAGATPETAGSHR